MPSRSINPKTQKVSFLPDSLSFFVAGFQYSDGAKGFDCKAEVTLQHEPDNRYDKEALAVYIGPTRVGYVPRPTNSFVLHILNMHGDLITWNLTSDARSNPERKHTELQITMTVD